jgi:hypothetical protein
MLPYPNCQYVPTPMYLGNDHYAVNNSLEANICTSIEALCGQLIYKMHYKRYELLAKNDIMLFIVGARRYSRVLQHIKKCDTVSSAWLHSLQVGSIGF